MASIKIKLAVDKTHNRVLFADVGSDFVDVLLGFLTLPLSALQFCAGGPSSSPGCLSNLCDSVDRFRGSKLLNKVEACHGMLLTPTHFHEFGQQCYGRVCRYNNSFVKNQLNLQVDGKFCKCWQVMGRLVHIFNHPSSASGTFARCKERFVISDDWMIKPASTSTIQSLTRRFSYGAVLHGFDEVEVCVSWEEVVSMLKASLSSDTIFTDVFLSRGTDDQATRVAVKPASISQNIKVTSGSLSESKIKLFYDRQEKKVMYAECKHDFVDLLLGFLTYPVGCVIKNIAVTSHLGRSSFDNLYNSAVELEAAGFLTGGYRKETLLNPPLAPFSSPRECSSLEGAVTEPENYTGLVPYSSCLGCPHDLVEDRNYLVDDDLDTHQASAMCVTKHWCERDKANVVEMDIAIGKQEAVMLLRAVLTSKTVLTDVFIDRLEENASQQKMQIFVKILKGKTLTVEVARSDTIATVKSRIMDKLTVPAGCRHELVYGSRYLEDSCTVADYNIVKECTITCEFYKN